MANKWAIANGNWSNGSTWNDGVVPTADDDVWLNGKVITLDTNVDIGNGTISNEPINEIAEGGNLTFTSVKTLTANLKSYGIHSLIRASVALGDTTFIINGDLYPQNFAGYYFIYKINSCNFVINGNVIGGNYNSGLFYFAATTYAGIVVNGNIDFENGTVGSGSITRLTINGFCKVYTPVEADINIPISITGNLTTKSPINASILNLYGNYYINYPIYNIFFSGVTGAVNFVGVVENVYSEFPKIIENDSELNYPQENVVSQGTVYGMQNEYEGRLALPQPSTVLKDVEYGDKVGTLEVIQGTVVENATIVEGDDISVVNLTEQQLQRVGNCATVSTVQKCFEDFKE